MDITTIRVNKKTAKKLRDFESYPKETYDDIIKRLLDKIKVENKK